MKLTTAQQDVLTCLSKGGSVRIRYSWRSPLTANACWLTLPGGFRVPGVRTATVVALLRLGYLRHAEGQRVIPGAVVNLEVTDEKRDKVAAPDAPGPIATANAPDPNYVDEFDDAEIEFLGGSPLTQTTPKNPDQGVKA